ncbi:unnamed protein product, partial [Closterium sp. NIES-54]
PSLCWDPVNCTCCWIREWRVQWICPRCTAWLLLLCSACATRPLCAPPCTKWLCCWKGTLWITR